MSLQVKKKQTNKPVLQRSNSTFAAPAEPAQVSSAAEQQQSQETQPSSSTNNVFGMMDIPESERNKIIQPDEYNKKLDRGELIFGVVPSLPTIKAIDDVTYDYCDGLRVFFPKTNDGEPIRTYKVLMKDELRGTVVCNDTVVSSEVKMYATVQKYYIPFGFTIVRVVNLPEELYSITMKHYNLTHIEVEMIYELCIIPEVLQEQIEQDIFNKCFVVHEEDKPRYAQAIRDLLKYVKDNHTFHHSFDPKDKEVMVQFPISTIGDSIGWFSYMERFQQKTQCKLYCVMNPAIYYLFEKQYPTINFIQAKDTRNFKPYASYNMGLFFKANTTHQPFDFRYIGNGRTVSKLLDVDDTDIPPRVDLSAPRKIKEPYVCIAVNGSAYCKMWTHPEGWQRVVCHLKEIGYKVVCIDRDKLSGNGVVITHMPWGVEDDTGNKPLQERIDILKDCDFFIGVSSGVSWLAWCAKCPVVMISGFTNPYNEYYTPYRVINPLVCHGCWNDETCDFDHFDYMWCPKHKNTPRAYECSKAITPEYVLNVIKTIPAYQKMKKKYDETHEPKVNEYLKEDIPMPVVETPKEENTGKQITVQPPKIDNETMINIM